MLTNNQKGRFNARLKEHGFNSKARHNILDGLDVELRQNMVAANEISLGYFDVAEDGQSAVPCNDTDNMESLFCFVSRTFDNGWQYIGYPIIMSR